MKSFLLRLSDGLHEWLKVSCVERGVSMNGFVVELLEGERALGLEWVSGSGSGGFVVEVVE